MRGEASSSRPEITSVVINCALQKIAIAQELECNRSCVYSKATNNNLHAV